jgi:hypothetical protein
MTRHLKKLEGGTTSNVGMTLNVPLLLWFRWITGEFEWRSGNDSYIQLSHKFWRT